MPASVCSSSKASGNASYHALGLRASSQAQPVWRRPVASLGLVGAIRSQAAVSPRAVR